MLEFLTDYWIAKMALVCFVTIALIVLAPDSSGGPPTYPFGKP